MTPAKRRPPKSSQKGGGRRGPKTTILHVDQPTIRFNRKHRAYRPAIVIRKGESKILAHEVEIKGPSRFIYSPYKPLSCGARLWIETEAEVSFK